MALIVETGQGLSDAESYASVSDATAYHAARGNPAAWSSASLAAQETALRSATDYIERKYASRWKGQRWLSTQRLAWPRSRVEVDAMLLPLSPLPRELREATFEMALRYVSGTTELIPDVTSPGTIKEESVKVGEIETKTVYMGGKIQQTDFAEVRVLIAPLVESGSFASLA